MNDYGKLQLAHNFLLKASLFISFSFVVFLFFAGRDIVRIWTQDKVLFQTILWILLLAYLPINCFWETSGLFQIATNKHKSFSLCKGGAAILGLVLFMMLAKIWGIGELYQDLW